MKCHGNAYNRKNTRNVVNVLDIWIRPPPNFVKINNLLILTCMQKNVMVILCGSCLIFEKPYSDNVNLSFISFINQTLNANTCNTKTIKIMCIKHYQT